MNRAHGPTKQDKQHETGICQLTVDGIERFRMAADRSAATRMQEAIGPGVVQMMLLLILAEQIFCCSASAAASSVSLRLNLRVSTSLLMTVLNVDRITSILIAKSAAGTH